MTIFVKIFVNIFVRILLVYLIESMYLGSLVAVGACCGLAALWHAGGQRVGEVLQDGRVVGPEDK